MSNSEQNATIPVYVSGLFEPRTPSQPFGQDAGRRDIRQRTDTDPTANSPPPPEALEFGWEPQPFSQDAGRDDIPPQTDTDPISTKPLPSEAPRPLIQSQPYEQAFDEAFELGVDLGPTQAHDYAQPSDTAPNSPVLGNPPSSNSSQQLGGILSRLLDGNTAPNSYKGSSSLFQLGLGLNLPSISRISSSAQPRLPPPQPSSASPQTAFPPPQPAFLSPSQTTTPSPQSYQSPFPQQPFASAFQQQSYQHPLSHLSPDSVFTPQQPQPVFAQVPPIPIDPQPTWSASVDVPQPFNVPTFQQEQYYYDAAQQSSFVHLPQPSPVLDQPPPFNVYSDTIYFQQYHVPPTVLYIAPPSTTFRETHVNSVRRHNFPLKRPCTPKIGRRYSPRKPDHVSPQAASKAGKACYLKSFIKKRHFGQSPFLHSSSQPQIGDLGVTADDASIPHPEPLASYSSAWQQPRAPNSFAQAYLTETSTDSPANVTSEPPPEEQQAAFAEPMTQVCDNDSGFCDPIFVATPISTSSPLLPPQSTVPEEDIEMEQCEGPKQGFNDEHAFENIRPYRNMFASLTEESSMAVKESLPSPIQVVVNPSHQHYSCSSQIPEGYDTEGERRSETLRSRLAKLGRPENLGVSIRLEPVVEEQPVEEAPVYEWQTVQNSDPDLQDVWDQPIVQDNDLQFQWLNQSEQDLWDVPPDVDDLHESAVDDEPQNIAEDDLHDIFEETLREAAIRHAEKGVMNGLFSDESDDNDDSYTTWGSSDGQSDDLGEWTFADATKIRHSRDCREQLFSVVSNFWIGFAAGVRGRA